MPDDYSFKEVSEACGTCQKAFEKEESLFSALCREGEGYIRLDYCPACWESRGRDDLMCFWKRKARVKEAQPTVDGNVLFDIFQRLEPSKERHDQNFRYIIGLLLMRRKRLKFLDVERTEEGELLILEDRRFDDVKHRLLDPSMNDEEMQKAKEEIEKLFAINVENKETKDEEDEQPEDEQRISEVHQS